MSKRQIIMILGAAVILVALFSGFPPAWNIAGYVIIGLLVIIVAYLMKPVHIPAKPKAPYIEHTQAPAEAPAQDHPVIPPPLP